MASTVLYIYFRSLGTIGSMYAQSEMLYVLVFLRVTWKTMITWIPMLPRLSCVSSGLWSMQDAWNKRTVQVLMENDDGT
jgi:hypothetical protein